MMFPFGNLSEEETKFPFYYGSILFLKQNKKLRHIKKKKDSQATALLMDSQNSAKSVKK